MKKVFDVVEEQLLYRDECTQSVEFHSLCFLPVFFFRSFLAHIMDNLQVFEVTLCVLLSPLMLTIINLLPYRFAICENCFKIYLKILLMVRAPPPARFLSNTLLTA